MQTKTAMVALLGLLGVAMFTSACAHPAPLPPKAIELNRDGAAALAGGDLGTAEARIALALEYNPKFVEAWVNLGLIDLRRGNLELAGEHLRRAKKLNPDLPTPHHGLGLVAEKEGKSLEAEKHYTEALHVDPGFAPARVNLGRLLFRRGAYDTAREQFLRLTEVAPESIEGWLGLCEVLLRLDRYDEAGEELELARHRFGDVPSLSVIRARLLLDADNFADAIPLLAGATEDSDRTRAAHAWAWLSVARVGIGDRDGALEAAHEAQRLDPDNEVARYAAGLASAKAEANARH